MKRTLALAAAALGAVAVAGTGAGTEAEWRPYQLSVRQLPGKRVALKRWMRSAGAVEVREVLAVGSGRRRVPLLVGRTRQRRLCLGSTGFLRCPRPFESQPIYVLAAFDGRRPAPTWGVVFGLATPDVTSVRVQRQDGLETDLALRRWDHFPFRAFASRPSSPNGRLPNSVPFRVLEGTRPGSVEVSWLYSGEGAQSGDGRPWVGEAIQAQQPREYRRQLELAKRLALANPVVRGIVPARAYHLGPVAAWLTCDGRLIGGVAHIELLQPVALHGRVPFASFDDASGTAYLEGEADIDADNVGELRVKVDVSRRRVVSVEPSGGDVRVQRFQIVGQLRPAGGPDLGACGPSGD